MDYGEALVAYWNGERTPEARRAWAEYNAEGRARRREDIPASVHGTVNGYNNYLCRCADCVRARAEYRVDKTRS